MASSLVSASIRGIRSYSPREDREQVIDFMPLTLIVGSNGTGKTTIIESLKFIISGSEPPHSDSRRNFIHEPRDEKFLGKLNQHDYACIELKFKDSSGQLCIAKRVISRASAGKSATPTTTSSYKVGARPWINVHRQDDWSKVMPQLFGLPNQAILNSVILCHQEENLWCMGDSSSVKLIFDKIFGCEEYKREMKYIEEEIKNSKKEQLFLQKDLDNIREKVLRKDEVVRQISSLEAEFRKVSTDVLAVTTELERLVDKKKHLEKTLDQSNRRAQSLEKLQQRVKELSERDAIYRKSLLTITVKRQAPSKSKSLRQQPLKKKPTPDPTLADLESIAEDFSKMISLIDDLPNQDDLDNLRTLIVKTLKKVIAVKHRFDECKNKPPSPLLSESESESGDEAELQVRKYRDEIEANITRNCKELESMQSDLESIQKESGDEPDFKETRDELTSVDREIFDIRDQRSHGLGSKMQMERELGRLKSELASYRKVNYAYAESLGKMVCNKIILEDLEKLRDCFKESITTFHDQMIVKINDLLRRRWKLIYQGTDIETIELVDEEITRGKEKKSYNYYIAMRKNGKRMKMREKSSAGQRALAAIILRMTLAELFVRDFAFIALDEPTANLDLANVQALAKSIGAYVRKRSKLGINIQWIIITHDEQFLRALDEECSPYFYRIKMDPTDKSSNIVKIAYHDSGLQTERVNGSY